MVKIQDYINKSQKVIEGKWIEAILDTINMFFSKKETQFEDIFKKSLETSFEEHKKLLIEKAMSCGKKSIEQTIEYENYKLDANSLIKKIKQKSQWNDISKLVFNEDQSFEEIVYPYIKEFLGILEDLMPDNSDESIRQLARNITKQLKCELINTIETNQHLFNKFLMEKLNSMGLVIQNIKEVSEEIKKGFEFLGVTKLNIDSIKSELEEFIQKNSKELSIIYCSNREDHAIQNEKLDQISEQLKGKYFNDFLKDLRNRLEAKDWPDFLKYKVLRNISNILSEFEHMGEEKTCKFLKTVLMEFFFYDKSMELKYYMEAAVKIVECIALIKLVYPELTLTEKTAKSLEIDDCRRICLLYTNNNIYKTAIVKLWKYINEYQPELKGVFRVIVSNQVCRICSKKKGADLKALGLDSYLSDFMRVMLTDGSKPEYNDLQVNFKEIVFHCKECLGSYEYDDMNFDKYMNILYAIFGEEGMMEHGQ